MKSLQAADLELLRALGGDWHRVDTLVIGLSRTSRYRRIQRLVASGLVERSELGYRSTPRGDEALADVVASFEHEPPLAPLLERAPTSEHRAMLELILFAIAARRADESGAWRHPSFLVIGPPRRWKTWIARAICRLVGEDESSGIVLASAESGRSLVARRSATGRVVTRRALLERSFVCFDEFQTATKEVRRIANLYLQGEKRVAFENDTLIVEPVPLVLMNPLPGDDLAARSGFDQQPLRRMIVLNVDNITIPAELRATGEQLLAAKAAQPFEIGAHAADPGVFLPRVARLLDRALLPEARATVDVDRIATLAVGASCFVGAEAALPRVVRSYLRVVSTLGWVRPGWSERIDGSRSIRPAEPDDRMRRFLAAPPSEDRMSRLDHEERLAHLDLTLRRAGVNAEDVAAVLREVIELGAEDMLALAELRNRHGSVFSAIANFARAGRLLRADQQKWRTKRARMKRALSRLGQSPIALRQAHAVGLELDRAGLRDHLPTLAALVAEIEPRGLGTVVTEIAQAGELRQYIDELLSDRRGLVEEIQRAAERLDVLRIEGEQLVEVIRQLRAALPTAVAEGLRLLLEGGGQRTEPAEVS